MIAGRMPVEVNAFNSGDGDASIACGALADAAQGGTSPGAIRVPWRALTGNDGNVNGISGLKGSTHPNRGNPDAFGCLLSDFYRVDDQLPDRGSSTDVRLTITVGRADAPETGTNVT